MKRTATAKWRGNLKQGKGLLTTESGTLSAVSYSFGKRFENERGTNPEELIAAAHSGCFAMAFSGELEGRGFTAETIDVQAEVFLERTSHEWGIPEIRLIVSANVPNASSQQIEQAAHMAKNNCPVSKLLKANITLEMRQTSQASVAPGATI